MQNIDEKFIQIDGRKIGKNFPPYIVAEMSGNHNGDINNAFEIIKKAKDDNIIISRLFVSFKVLISSFVVLPNRTLIVNHTK